MSTDYLKILATARQEKLDAIAHEVRLLAAVLAKIEPLDGLDMILKAQTVCVAMREGVAMLDAQIAAVRMVTTIAAPKPKTPAHAVVTVGTTINDEPGADVTRVALADVEAHLDNYTYRTDAERETFQAWLTNAQRRDDAIGDYWTVEDRNGDNVATVVLV